MEKYNHPKLIYNQLIFICYIFSIGRLLISTSLTLKFEKNFNSLFFLKPLAGKAFQISVQALNSKQSTQGYRIVLRDLPLNLPKSAKIIRVRKKCRRFLRTDPKEP